MRLIEGFGAGSAPDVVARLIGQALSEQLGQPFVIENRSGSSSNIAAEHVARATPDGYTLLLLTSANAINATMYKLSFYLMRDLVSSFGEELSEVRITDVKDGVFFARLVFASGVEVDARPSDSIALALRTGSKIVCSPDVLGESGVQVADEDEAEVEKFREFLDQIKPEDFEHER